jgi:hypothetical protein
LNEPDQSLGTTYQRMALARWLTDVEHGAGALLARVIVNRLWQHHFGEGLVRTPDDFGATGSRPDHPELLERLAGELIRGGWRIKPIHRQILSSAVYRQSTAGDPAGMAVDADDHLLWHRRPTRLEAEALRDAMLAASGRLNSVMFGPPFRPRIPAEAISTRSNDAYPADIRDGPPVWRRSVYAFIKRSVPNPLAEVFDAPDSTAVCGRRNTTAECKGQAIERAQIRTSRETPWDRHADHVQKSTRTWAGNTAIPARVTRALASTETFLSLGSRARWMRPASLMPAHFDNSTSSSEVMRPNI